MRRPGDAPEQVTRSARMRRQEAECRGSLLFSIANLKALQAKRRIKSDRSGRQWRSAALAGAAEEAWCRLEAAPRRVGDRAERENERNQRQCERCKACDRRTMQRTLVMLVPALRGGSSAIRVADADREAGRARGGR